MKGDANRGASFSLATRDVTTHSARLHVLLWLALRVIITLLTGYKCTCAQVLNAPPGGNNEPRFKPTNYKQ